MQVKSKESKVSILFMLSYDIHHKLSKIRLKLESNWISSSCSVLQEIRPVLRYKLKLFIWIW